MITVTQEVCSGCGLKLIPSRGPIAIPDPPAVSPIRIHCMECGGITRPGDGLRLPERAKWLDGTDVLGFAVK